MALIFRIVVFPPVDSEPMHLIFFPFASVTCLFQPNLRAETWLHALLVVAEVSAAIGKLLTAHSLFLVFNPEALVPAAIRSLQFAKAMLFVAVPSALVDLSIFRFKSALSMGPPNVPLPLVRVPVFIDYGALTMSETAKPLPIVDRTRLVLELPDDKVLLYIQGYGSDSLHELLPVGILA